MAVIGSIDTESWLGSYCKTWISWLCRVSLKIKHVTIAPLGLSSQSSHAVCRICTCGVLLNASLAWQLVYHPPIQWDLVSKEEVSRLVPAQFPPVLCPNYVLSSATGPCLQILGRIKGKDDNMYCLGSLLEFSPSPDNSGEGSYAWHWGLYSLWLCGSGKSIITLCGTSFEIHIHAHTYNLVK